MLLIFANVRRYVALALSRGGMGFCHRAGCGDLSGSRNHREMQKP